MVEIVDWGAASEQFDSLAADLGKVDLSSANEAQTRYDIIDRFLRNVLGWREPGSVKVEERPEGTAEFIDYVIRVGDQTVVVEAKKVGASFPSPTRRRQLKLSGSVLGIGETALAIAQALTYARSLSADVAVVTNGRCWVAFPCRPDYTVTYATLAFPFDNAGDAERLFRLLAPEAVANGSLFDLTQELPRVEDRLISVVRDADARVDRNNVADHIVPALNAALYADALLADVDSLRRCFVDTEARTRFDGQLRVHLADPKPVSVSPARRIQKGKRPDELARTVEGSQGDFAPPVTLIIGPVGAGKSTYLRHFSEIAAKEVLENRKAHWIYVDLEKMGPGEQPRSFIYRELRNYLIREHPASPTDYKTAVEPAYKEEIAGLARGPLALVANQPDEFKRRVAGHIEAEYEAVEPYVDKVLGYLSKKQLCVVVLDNVDLYEDAGLESAVFGEGLSLSKRIYCHVIVSIRDRTFIQHRSDSAFDAYELRKLWLDPPPFREVLSTRFHYARKTLEGVRAEIPTSDTMRLTVPDMSVFFDIVQRSLLSGPAGQYIESMADTNIRRGLTLVNNFLTSGHIQANRLLSAYLAGDQAVRFPFHEVFKGSALGQWLHFRERRADVINLFDARLSSARGQLARLWILNHLVARARSEETLEVPVAELYQMLGGVGVTSSQVLELVAYLQENGLLRTTTSEDVDLASSVTITRSGGYYAQVLAGTFVYAESCLLDTAIQDPEAWSEMSAQTLAVESESNLAKRMRVRFRRIGRFVDYLIELEERCAEDCPELKPAMRMRERAASILFDGRRAVRGADRNFAA